MEVPGQPVRRSGPSLEQTRLWPAVTGNIYQPFKHDVSDHLLNAALWSARRQAEPDGQRTRWSVTAGLMVALAAPGHRDQEETDQDRRSTPGARLISLPAFDHVSRVYFLFIGKS